MLESWSLEQESMTGAVSIRSTEAVRPECLPALGSTIPIRDQFAFQEFGVTSEGVFVFLQEALRDAGIDAKNGQKFTVKLTGVRDDICYQ